MLLQDVFPPECIKLNLESEDKDEVFEELVDVFVRSTKLDIRDEVMKAIYDREVKMSTGIKRGIAIPHGKTAAVDSIYGVIGISRKGVDYDALDGEPVHLLFLLISSPKNSEQHLKILKRLAILLDNPLFYQDILEASDPAGVHRIIQKYENLLMFQE